MFNKLHYDKKSFSGIFLIDNNEMVFFCYLFSVGK